eukprot:SAG11_NODE_1534_length_4732_cov_1.778545_6_plen_39_part_00
MIENCCIHDRIEYSVNSQCRYSTEIVLPRYYMKDTNYF